MWWSGWARGRASWQAWMVLGVVLSVPVVSVARASAGGGMDNAIVLRAVQVWWNGGSPYDDPHFLYLPSGIPAAAQQLFLPSAVLRLLVLSVFLVSRPSFNHYLVVGAPP